MEKGVTELNIIEAVEGPFSTWLGEPTPWLPWRSFLKSLAGVALSPDERLLFQRCTGRTQEFSKPVSEAWVVVGRRGRKSAVASLLAIHSAVFCDWSNCIAPGETARVLVIAVTKEQAKIVRSYCEALLRSHSELEALISTVDQDSISLTNGIVIQCVANSFRSIRGPAVVCAIFEELAFWRSDESATPDVEILRAVRPAMLTTKKHGALLIGISSPYAKRGLLYEKWKEHFGHDDSNVLVWHADTATMNPEVDQLEIDQAYKDDPASASSEYGAQFRDDIANFLDSDLIAKLTRTSPLEIPPKLGINYFAFIDSSGGRGDAMTLGISHQEKDGRNILDLARGVPAPFDPATVVKEFASILKSYRLNEATGDAYSGAWCADAFKAEGITYKTSPLNKSAIYLETLPLFTQGLVELPDLRQLLVQLASLERRTARGGKDSVDHPSGKGSHDDYANSACGALHLASQGSSTDWNVGCGGPTQIPVKLPCGEGY